MSMMDNKTKSSIDVGAVIVTAIPIDNPNKESSAQSTTSPDSVHDVAHSNSAVFASLPQLRKNLIYTVISLALAIDLLNTWGLFTAIDKIARDVGLEQGGNAVWIVSAYAVAFAACIPLGGRLCDVFPVQWWFTGGFAGMACLNLGNSFGESC
jgi:hypothetical protein